MEIKVDFMEAFAAYEEGKEIKSLESKFSYKKMYGENFIYSNIFEDWINNELGFFPSEIKGKWYIND